ncbi:sensor histidine kinase [Mesoterricola silvestris]|uniref:sensor histidine kinase n=1 Tax=Mesoterricola silvestris TaxID=2927979 RepID=UPI00292E6690|nr:two-component regulator propeller domain-containing protein [Mesoterricola silvestris]
MRLALALCLAAWAFAGAPPGAGPVRVFNASDGVPQMAIYALAADHQGRLWAGTLAGVARFDGQAWKAVEGPPSRYALLVNANSMTCTSDGAMWIGTRFQGYLEYRQGAWKVHDLQAGLPINNVNQLIESSRLDRSGRRILYGATHGRGVVAYQDGAWQRLGGDLSEERTFCLLEREGALWVGSARGVWILEQGRWRPFEGNGALADPLVRALAESTEPDGSRSLWIGTEKGGLYRWRKGRLEALPMKERMGNTSVRALLGGGDGSMWVGTSGGGMAQISGDQWLVRSTHSGLQSDFIRCLAFTPGGPDGSVLWAGSDGKGIFRIHSGGWRRVTVPWPHADPRVQAFAETRNPATGQPVLWMANTCLASLEQGVYTIHKPNAGPVSETMRSLYAFPGEQDLYFGMGNSLGRFSQGRFRFWSEKEGFAQGTVRVLAGTRDARGGRVLWIGTSRGLVRWDGAAFQAMPPPPGDPKPSVRSLDVDGSRLWVGTDKGLACLEGEAWVSPPVLANFPPVGVHALLQLRSDLVVGTFGSGVIHFENPGGSGGHHTFTTRNTPALRQDLVYDLVQDGAGRIYVSSPRGVARVDPGRGWTWDNFSTEDGLPGMECIKGSLFRDSRGRIWVGTEDGPAWLEPGTSTQDSVPKPLVWESAVVRGRSLAQGERLSHRDQGVRFEFRLLTGHREQDTVYRTQLVGLQDAPGDWSGLSYAQFPSLPAGRYTMLVWGRDYAGNQTGPLAFPFRVLPAPWFSPLAWGIYAVLLGGGVLALLRLRTRVLADRNRELMERIGSATREIEQRREEQEKLNRELVLLNLEKTQFMGIAAHDLRNPLNTIILVSDGLVTGDLEDCPPEIGPWVRKIATSAHHMTALIDEFLDVNAIESGMSSPRARAVAIQEILDPLASLYKLRLDAKGQVLVVEGEGRVLADPNHLRQILDNLLSNASKFSPSGAVLRIRVIPGPAATRIEVIDQGPGIQESEKANLFRRFVKLSARPTGGESSSGLGLSIVKHLVDANHGRVWVERPSDVGCAFCLELPSTTEG